MVLQFWCQNIFFVLDVLEWEDIHGAFSDGDGYYGNYTVWSSTFSRYISWIVLLIMDVTLDTEI